MIWPFRRPVEPPTTMRHPLGYIKDQQRPDVFDPALKQYPYAFVHGAPTSSNEALSLAEKRSYLLQLTLVALGNSSVRDELVLRGSLTLETWFPGRARRAHDVDLVIRDTTTTPFHAASEELLTEIAIAARDAIRTDVVVLDDQIALDSIWTYERAEGRRITLPWRHETGMQDVVQIDVVFQEPLQDEPVLETLRSSASEQGSVHVPPPSLWFASKAESLAWKLLWLDTDAHKQAKDLYDAILLAEHVPLPKGLVQRVFAAKANPWKYETNSQLVRSWVIDTQHFALEYPELSLEGGPRVERLEKVLRLVE